MRHVYDTFDTVCVQFSGGKDSTAVLYLAKEIHEERGLGPVKVIFRDEEMVSPSVIKFVEEVRNYDWVDMEWYCLPQGQEVWVLGRREYCLLWSAQRERDGRLVREIPPWAIRAEHFGLTANEVIPQSIDYYTMQGKQGRVAFITGVRANESMIRYRSCVQKLHENYIVVPFRMKKSIPLRFAKVIYDWTTDDVFKFVTEEHGGKFCDYYDLAAMTHSNSRVGIPLHAVAVRRIGDVVATEPEFYDELVRCFPQVDAQRRYWPEFDIERLIKFYADDGWDGVKLCIEHNMLTNGIKRRAMAFAAEFRKKHATDPYSYPIEWLVRNLLLNEFNITSVNPVGPKTRAHAVRMAAAQAEAEANSLDLQDDLR
jgi:predicted phosphoadenosine phosphosulfate sulfurtransferase